MRIVHVQRSSGIGGSERHLLMLLPALVRRGLDVTMVVLRTGGGERFVEALESSGVEAMALDMRGHVNPGTVAQLAHFLRRLRPDLVHTHLIHGDVHGQVAARLAGVPGVSTMHGTPAPYRQEPARSAAAVAGRLARRTIAISHHVARFLQERRIVPSDRIGIVHYGIDAIPWQLSTQNAVQAREDLGFDADQVVVLVASRVVRHKGHDFLLDAFAVAAASRPKLRLLIAGDGPLRPRLEARASTSAFSDRIKFLGFVNDLPTVMAASDIVAFPTMPGFGEGFGLVNLEAMAAGRPVVGTALDSIPEIVIDGATGYLVTPGDVAGLAAALGRLTDDSAIRQRMGEAGRQRAITTFSLERMVERTVNVYLDVVQRPARTKSAVN